MTADTEPLAAVLARLDGAKVRQALVGGADVEVITVTVADAARLRSAVADAVVREADVPMRTARVEPAAECPA